VTTSWFLIHAELRCTVNHTSDLQFILSVNYSKFFGWFLHHTQHTHTCPNSSTVPTGSNNSWLVPDAVDRVICAPYDGVERPPETCRAVLQIKWTVHSCILLVIYWHIICIFFLQAAEKFLCPVLGWKSFKNFSSQSPKLLARPGGPLVSSRSCLESKPVRYIFNKLGEIYIYIYISL